MPGRRLRERGRIDRVHDPERRPFAHALYAAGREHDDTQPDRLARWRNVEPETAELLGVLIRTKRAPRVLEIGTSNGYSTIWLADAAPATGGALLTPRSAPPRPGPAGRARAHRRDRAVAHGARPREPRPRGPRGPRRAQDRGRGADAARPPRRR